MSEATQSPEDAAAQRAAEQARLRKERREAKLKAGGSARLNKITGLGGRIPGDPEPTTASTAMADAPTPAPAPAPAASASAASATADHADPEEVDISDHYYEPKRTATSRTNAPEITEPAISEDQLRQMMLGFERGNGSGTASPAPGAAEEDPMMKMMSQLMAGAGLPAGSMPPFPGMPGMAPGQGPPVPPTAVRNSASTNLWRLLHALVALGLGFYIVILTPFTGSKIERERAALAGTTPADPLIAAAEPELETELEHRKKLFFWTFATAESLLLTTRFFLDRTGSPPSGIVGTVVQFLPQPAKGYVEVVMRYGQIFTTVRSDMLACIFVLGAVAWFKG
ncbi:hypothetical protein FOCG_06623 [Fusarium oxysporum f. sp. radicis-lycopersici 26381]|uniref:Golgi to ER traffic protein 2 n=1 Tax=Fusarium oxysporum Fo47 TaxID=660027 RepID=W9KU35_FUSOX|nr:uncharacterized protein FOBCDRAFT_215431 [Fusarium oxysporum Fo47]EWZ47946.1 hypothetical protein FOZG_03682 [Fusarium oxysporum Fo47]EXL53278.1 hypothetical protein FOCG_06623 [Fusarium oxysporum f. sp. radicis-lycopersici 26381]QKD49765.2 hypothetical protein FOBCDRAFT_215431 [Fusarium oxysporum Fo47]